jgi:outer membrane protein
MGEMDVQSTTVNKGLTASYTLFSGLQGITSYRLLQSQVESSQLHERKIRDNALMLTAQHYFNVLMAQDNLKILRAQLDISRQRLAQSRDMLDRGMRSSLESLAAQVDFDADSTSVLAAEFNYRDALRSLNLHMGWELDRRYDVVDLEWVTGDYADMGDLSLQGNTAYLLQQEAEHQSDLILKKTKGSYLPRVSLSTTYGSQQTNMDLNMSRDNPDLTMSTGLSLNWNLFDGRKKRAIESDRLMIRNAELGTLAAWRQAENDLASAMAEYDNSRSILSLSENALESAQLNYNQTSEYYRMGQASSTQFRDSQLNLSRAKISQTQSRYAVYLNELSIWYITGTLEERIKAL